MQILGAVRSRAVPCLLLLIRRVDQNATSDPAASPFDPCNQTKQIIVELLVLVASLSKTCACVVVAAATCLPQCQLLARSRRR